MLRSLSISNYALIRSLDVDFKDGLSTITGETGAGKSILLGALSLILGQRADTTVLLDKDNKCIVEGSFDNNPRIEKILEHNELDSDKILILRREISPAGKSRAFVNDTPVTLQVMNDIGQRLIDIHSQHENLHLNNNIYQLNVVDAYAALNEELAKYRKRYFKYRELISELERLESSEVKNRSEQDYLEYQFKELQEARLEEGEQAELESELDSLSHAEEIKAALFNVSQMLSGEEINVVGLLKNSLQLLQKVRDYHKVSGTLYDRIDTSLIELQDIAMEAENAGENMEHDPSRQEYVQERINLLYKLEQKHHASDVNELIKIREELDRRINDLSSLEDRIVELKKITNAEKEELVEMASELSRKREAAFPLIEEKITALLVQLGIPRAEFKIVNDHKGRLSEYGLDEIRFMFTANSKSAPQDISKIASGGEISRLMLSIKSIISHSIGLPTIILDEIDTGVSGDIAFRVAGIMNDMARDRQVFTITHLPQVASRGDQQYLVYKKDGEEGAMTLMRLLNKEERLSEIAKMLSGSQTTKAALANAKELLQNN